MEHTNLSPRHVSLVVVKGAGGDEGSGAGAEALARLWPEFVTITGFGKKKRTEVTHSPSHENTQRDDKKDALTVGSIHMQYNVSPSD